MNEPEAELKTILDDVKTIKAILQGQDAPFPRVYRVPFLVSAILPVLGLLQFLVPFFREMGFDQRLLWLWLPAALITAPLVLVLLHFEVKRSGRQFLGQGRMRHLMFARFIVPPAILILFWVSSRNPVFALEGVALILASVWQTAVEQVFPSRFRLVPVVFLTLGVVELSLGLRGPEVVLFNILLVAATLLYAGLLLKQQNDAQAKA